MRGTQMVLLYENMCRAGMARKYPLLKHIPYIPRPRSASPRSRSRSLRLSLSPPPPLLRQARGVMLFCALFNYTPKPGRVTYCRAAKGTKKRPLRHGPESAAICSSLVNQRRSDRRYFTFQRDEFTRVRARIIERVSERALRNSFLRTFFLRSFREFMLDESSQPGPLACANWRSIGQFGASLKRRALPRCRASFPRNDYALIR